MNITEILGKWFNFYKEFYNRTNLKQGIISLVDELKSNFKDITFKAKHLSQTNFDLGIYHFSKGNVNDALLRFKIAKFFNPTLQTCDYYLGRGYYEKFSYQKAKPYLEEYLRSGNKDFVTEAQFTLNIINNQIAKVNEIPKSIIKNTFNQAAAYYDFSFSQATQSTPQQDLFSHVSQILSDKNKPFGNNILDIGCGTGMIGKFCRIQKIANSIIGVDFSTNMLEKATASTQDGLKVYNKTENKDAFEFIDQLIASNHAKFDIIIASNFLTYNPIFDQFFKKTEEICKEDGILAITFKTSSNNKEIEFNSRLEQFQFLPEYVKTSASKQKWKLLKEEDTTFISRETGKVMIFGK